MFPMSCGYRLYLWKGLHVFYVMWVFVVFDAGNRSFDNSLFIVNSETTRVQLKVYPFSSKK
jgi:hypothetical protein